MYNTLNNPSAHPSYSHYYLLSPSTLFFFAHLIVFCTFNCFLHILLFCTSYCFALFISLHILLLFLFFYHIYTIYMLLCSCVVLLYINFIYFFSTVTMGVSVQYVLDVVANCEDIQWNKMLCLTGPRCYMNTDIQQ